LGQNGGSERALAGGFADAYEGIRASRAVFANCRTPGGGDVPTSLRKPDWISDAVRQELDALRPGSIGIMDERFLVGDNFTFEPAIHRFLHYCHSTTVSARK
jgi:hypothetical protein